MDVEHADLREELAAHLGVAELVLGLRLGDRLLQPDGNGVGHAFADIKRRFQLQRLQPWEDRQGIPVTARSEGGSTLHIL